MRIAGAPISWGVCEVPGWGHQMAPDRVLTEMRQIGLTATEFGPQGWLPVDPTARAAAVGKYGLTPVGSFFLALMHDPRVDPMPAVERELEAFDAAGGDHLILACDSGREGYDHRPVLDERGWTTLFDTLMRIRDLAAARGVTACVHPHWGTMIQEVDEVERLLDHTDMALCLDTGHLTAGGADIVALVHSYAPRVAIVHAKDVHTAMTEQLRRGEITWSQGVRAGMFAPIGDGDLDFAAVVAALDAVGFNGYYVLEQDIMLDAEPPEGQGPITNVRASLEALTALGAH